MLKKLLPLAIVVLVPAGLITAALLKNSSSDSSSHEPKVDTRVYSGEAVVRMTEDGFIPEVLRITKGTTVRFVNEDKYAHWPASDLHPTHTIYSEFDPRKPIPAGEEWSFVFEKVGEWKMHDHIAPYLTGKIVVVENE